MSHWISQFLFAPLFRLGDNAIFTRNELAYIVDFAFQRLIGYFWTDDKYQFIVMEPFVYYFYRLFFSRHSQIPYRILRNYTINNKV